MIYLSRMETEGWGYGFRKKKWGGRVHSQGGA